jgi:hypothetical protein
MSDPAMIPLGYMLKRVASPAPDWMGAPYVVEVHSLSGCVSLDLEDYVTIWQHNGWWLFDTADKAREAAAALKIDVGPLRLFYYEAFYRQFNEFSSSWEAFEPHQFPTDVVPPQRSELSGFDVVTFFLGTSPECSPLSCNSLAASVPVNRWCLFGTLEGARAALEDGSVRNTEPGPNRIIAVYAVEDQTTIR